MSIKIDKSVFTPEELETYKALIAKATVDPEASEEMMEEERPDFPPRRKRVVEDEDFAEEREVDETEKSCRTRKSADPQLSAALHRLETLEKSLAMKEFTDIAKKYAPLGENEEELAKTLYEMKKSNEANYGIFAEIGKSGAAYNTGSGALGKIETIAAEIQKSDTNLSHEQAIMKAWDMHPELVAEYDQEYRK